MPRSRKSKRKNKKNKSSSARPATSWLWQGFCRTLDRVKNPALWALLVAVALFLTASVQARVGAGVGGTPTPQFIVITIVVSPTACPCTTAGLPVLTPTLSPTPSALGLDYGFYVIQPNDTMTGIARRFQTTASEILQLNHLEEGNPIYPGQVLKIPISNLPESSGK